MVKIKAKCPQCRMRLWLKDNGSKGCNNGHSVIVPIKYRTEPKHNGPKRRRLGK